MLVHFNTKNSNVDGNTLSTMESKALKRFARYFANEAEGDTTLSIKVADKKFRYKVDHHSAAQHKVFVPAKGGKGVAPPGGKRCKHTVEQPHFKHGCRHVGRRSKGVTSVYRKVVQHR